MDVEADVSRDTFVPRSRPARHLVGPVHVVAQSKPTWVASQPIPHKTAVPLMTPARRDCSGSELVRIQSRNSVARLRCTSAVSPLIEKLISSFPYRMPIGVCRLGSFQFLPNTVRVAEPGSPEAENIDPSAQRNMPSKLCRQKDGANERSEITISPKRRKGATLNIRMAPRF